MPYTNNHEESIDSFDSDTSRVFAAHSDYNKETLRLLISSFTFVLR
jgi:hypothetical protein